jgi:transposase
MMQIAPQMRILLAVEPQDFRKGIDGLGRVCRELLGDDPFGGTLFVFRNRSATALKILCYDGQGFWLCQKRLSEGRFRWWPKAEGGSEVSRSLLARELQVLLWNGDASAQKMAPLWKRLNDFAGH